MDCLVQLQNESQEVYGLEFASAAQGLREFLLGKEAAQHTQTLQAVHEEEEEDDDEEEEEEKEEQSNQGKEDQDSGKDNDNKEKSVSS